ncbi:MAG TPA: ABC transporter permease [Gemmatimonadaceae bacterium]|nr:ABC transporter permease [Gemmatimonadaceae bacterium]
MTTREPTWRRYARLWGPDVRADVDDELAFHLETRAAEHVARGVPPAEARARARAEFGDLEAARRRCLAIDRERLRRRRRGEIGEAIRSDLRLAVRGLARRPGFTVVVLLTLALGIGANTAIFSVVHGVLLRPLPYAAPERLVALWPDHFVSNAELLYLRERMHTAERVETYSPGWSVALTGAGEPAQLPGARVSTGFFDALGVPPLLGRTFRPADARPSTSDVVVLSHALWRTRFGADPTIVGRRILLDGTPETVVGVMPPGFWYRDNDVRLWQPIVVDSSAAYHRESSALAIARLRPGATPATALAELRALVAPMREALAYDADYGRDVDVVTLRDALVGSVRTPLLVLLGAVACIVLIAVANVGNLLLVRGAERRREMAVRMALGAGRARLVRQLLVESVVLAAAGGALGVALGVAGVPLLRALLPADLPRVQGVGASAVVLAASAGVTLLAGLLVGLVPAWLAARSEPQGALRGRTDDGSAVAGRRLRAGLVVGEVALAFTLTVGAGLMVRTLWNLSQVDPGFQSERRLTFSVAPSGGTAKRRQYVRDLEARLRALPGVRAVGATNHLPLTGYSWSADLAVDGQPLAAGAVPPRAAWRIVTEDYFRAMGIALRAGRAFTPADDADAPPVVIVNERLARQLWPGERALGKRLQAGFATMQQMATVVGVVGDVRHDGLTAAPPAELYVPLTQRMAGPMHLVVRTEGDPLARAADVRAAARTVDADVPLAELRTLDALVATSVAEPRLVMVLLLLFGALGLALGAVGVYGVVSYTVGQRTREIGVRMALGAEWRAIVRLVMGSGARYAVAGVGLGLAATLALSRAVQGLVYGVTVTDPATYAALALLLVGIVLLASWLPARRAARVDPTVVLRGD